MLADFLDQLLIDYNDFIANNNKNSRFLLLKLDHYIYTEEHPCLPSDPYCNERIVRLYTNTNIYPYALFHISEQIIQFTIPNVRFTINGK